MTVSTHSIAHKQEYASIYLRGVWGRGLPHYRQEHRVLAHQVRILVGFFNIFFAVKKKCSFWLGFFFYFKLSHTEKS